MTVVLEPIIALTAAMTLEESKETLEPLFVAIVDPIDTSAVYGVIAVVPTEDGKGWRTFERQYGEWVEDPSWVAEITGLSPPTMVVMDPSTTVDVIEQVDAYDAANPPEEEEE